jgi:short-subunit dehydrogenase
MITAQECATDIMNAADARKRLVITPVWYTPVYFLRKFFPTLIDNFLIKTFAPYSKKKESK